MPSQYSMEKQVENVDSGFLVVEVPSSKRGGEQVHADAYRGMHRNTVDGFSVRHLADDVRFGGSVGEAAAGLAVQALSALEYADGDFIRRFMEARDVYCLLGATNDWEMLWVRLAVADVKPPPYSPPMDLLGYEPTWFWGNHFSPLWNTIAAQTTELNLPLNEYALFDSSTDAEVFLKNYLSRDDREGGSFWIAEIYRVPDVILALSSFTWAHPDRKETMSNWDIEFRALPGTRRYKPEPGFWNSIGLDPEVAGMVLDGLPATLTVRGRYEPTVVVERLSTAGFDVSARPARSGTSGH